MCGGGGGGGGWGWGGATAVIGKFFPKKVLKIPILSRGIYCIYSKNIDCRSMLTRTVPYVFNGGV